MICRKMLISISALLVMLNLSACTPAVSWRTSTFDNSRSLEMQPANLFDDDGKAIANITLVWDDSMKKGTSFAKLTFNSEHNISSKTVLNINPDGKILVVKLADSEKTAKIASNLVRETNLATGRTRSYTNVFTKDTTILYFQVPDGIIQKVSASKGVKFMINFAHNEKVVLTPSMALRPWFGNFYSMKYGGN